MTPWKIHLSTNITLINMGSIDTIHLQCILSSQKKHSLMPLSMLILMILLMISWGCCIYKVLLLYKISIFLMLLKSNRILSYYVHCLIGLSLTLSNVRSMLPLSLLVVESPIRSSNIGVPIFFACNVKQHNEPVARDTVFSDTPAVHSVVTAAQICVGREALVADFMV
jgi:hypothetical protein